MMWIKHFLSSREFKWIMHGQLNSRRKLYHAVIDKMNYCRLTMGDHNKDDITCKKPITPSPWRSRTKPFSKLEKVEESLLRWWKKRFFPNQPDRCCATFNHFHKPFMINQIEMKLKSDHYRIVCVPCFDVFGSATSPNIADKHHSWLMDRYMRDRDRET